MQGSDHGCRYRPGRDGHVLQPTRLYRGRLTLVLQPEGFRQPVVGKADRPGDRAALDRRRERQGNHRLAGEHCLFVC